MKARFAVAGFEDGVKGLRAKKCWKLLDVEKVKEVDSHLELPEGTKSCLRLDLPRKPVRPSADF